MFVRSCIKFTIKCTYLFIGRVMRCIQQVRDPGTAEVEETERIELSISGVQHAIVFGVVRFICPPRRIGLTSEQVKKDFELNRNTTETRVPLKKSGLGIS